LSWYLIIQSHRATGNLIRRDTMCVILFKDVTVYHSDIRFITQDIVSKI